MQKKDNRGGKGRGQGRKPKTYKETIVSKSFSIPESKHSLFTALAKKERAKVEVNPAPKMKAVK